MSASIYPPTRTPTYYRICRETKRAWRVMPDGREMPVIYQQAVGLCTLGLAREQTYGRA